jgi:uncharacterized protein YdeI (YjbR/CyaY-like superfamily)
VAEQNELLHFRRREDWRAWLQSNHRHSTEAWLILSKARYRQGDLSLSDAVEEALCFGWIDGKLRAWTGSATRSVSRRAGRPASGPSAISSAPGS